MSPSDSFFRSTPQALQTVRKLHSLGVLSPLDVELCLALGRRFVAADSLGLLTAALTSRAVQQGHICLDLHALTTTPLLDASEQPVEIEHPEVNEWESRLRESPLCSGPAAPLVLENNGRVYLRRYARYQRQLLDSIHKRLARPADFDEDLLRDGLERFFPTGTQTNWQRVAALLSITRHLTIISGGPGTGKTTTVARILALIGEQHERLGQPLLLQMVAPTGKAAQRLTESLHAGLETLRLSDALQAQLRVQTSTIHRALGFQMRTPTRFARDATNPLLANVVVVDEASMVDLALMTKLFEAVPLDSRLILLGDKDQLASVEAGAVFGDLFNADAEPCYGPSTVELAHRVTGDSLKTSAGLVSSMADSVVHLRKSYRYGMNSGIGALARAIREGDVEATMDALTRHPDVEWLELPETTSFTAEPAMPHVTRLIAEGYHPYMRASGAQERLRCLNRFRILCAHRHGPLGVIHLNQLAEASLVGVTPGINQRFYAGRPLLIAENDYQLELFNGDVGVVDRDPRGRLVAYFPSGERLRLLQTGRLPSHETVFAMTVHKSQGSEFDRVGLVLPSTPSPIITRELLYTAVTRARSGVVVIGSRRVLAAGLTRRIQRSSGLREALWTTRR